MQRILPILPITDLRNHAKEVLKQAQSQPVVITQNGRPGAVLLNYKSYNELIDLIAEFEALRQQEREQWSLASEESLRRVWDNPADAAYDNWKALYGL